MKIDVKNLKPKERRYSIAIENGLTIRVHPSGVKSWVVRIPQFDRIIDITLGHYPDVTERQARHLARVKRKEFELAPPKGYIMNDAFRLWRDLKKGQIASFEDERDRLRKYVFDIIGRRQIDEVTTPMLIALIKPLDRAGKRSTVKRISMRMSEIFNLAKCAGYVRENPASGMSRVFAPPKVKPMPALHWLQLPEILEYIFKNASRKIQLLFLFSLCTLLRPGEIAKLRWSWIDLESRTISIPAEEMKKKRVHRVPISDFCLHILLEIRELFPAGNFLFPGRRRSDHMSSQTLAKWLCSQTPFRDKLVAHGLRSMGRCYFADHGISYEVAEACLAHVVGSTVSRAYQRSDFLDARRPVIAAWSNYVQSCAKSAQIRAALGTGRPLLIDSNMC